MPTRRAMLASRISLFIWWSFYEMLMMIDQDFGAPFSLVGWPLQGLSRSNETEGKNKKNACFHKQASARGLAWADAARIGPSTAPRDVADAAVTVDQPHRMMYHTYSSKKGIRKLTITKIPWTHPHRTTPTERGWCFTNPCVFIWNWIKKGANQGYKMSR